MTPRPGKSSRKNAKIENASIFGAQIRFGPTGLIVYADHFLAAAKLAAADIPYNPARMFLTCRTLELAFKAFLSLKGYPLAKLAGGPFAHDLENLLLEADTQNLHELVTLSESHRVQIIRASGYYHEKVFEYPALMEALGGYPDLPEATELVSAADAIISAIRELCLIAAPLGGECPNTRAPGLSIGRARQD
jgi:hypothetical protein